VPGIRFNHVTYSLFLLGICTKMYLTLNQELLALEATAVT